MRNGNEAVQLPSRMRDPVAQRSARVHLLQCKTNDESAGLGRDISMVLLLYC